MQKFSPSTAKQRSSRCS